MSDSRKCAECCLDECYAIHSKSPLQAAAKLARVERETLERCRRELIDLFAKRTVDADYSWRGDYMEGLDDAIKRVAELSEGRQ